ncbi:hypothetical protein [Autumnicola musiva]|uniref:HNH nuclease domain-containing protein n=1 Tax=Autumnicola musiva TaxID=3075589 RepID=A0ABU3D4L2_9FLAO|nr:hypothetical protein [Zunongwangia sp. F117]MDT0676472.1 hypothetical protein [Zunongwangia sp. F117]
MARLKPKESVIKRLFALSGNQCAYPSCKEHIVDELGTVIGEVCHIEAAEIGGERYNIDSNDEYRRSFENLILMCSNHHKKTNNTQKYPTPILIKYKLEHENHFVNQPYIATDDVINKSIQNFMQQKNNNTGQGSQFNNQASKQNIKNQIGVQNVYNNSPKIGSPNVDGARPIIQKFKTIIDGINQDATAPSSDVIDFRNELKERFPRDVKSIPTKYLRFRKNNGRIIADVESYEKENNVVLNEEDDSTQEKLREFLLNNDKEKNEELKRSLSQKGQQRPAIITCDGFLINGNRRKMALEELYNSKNQNSQYEMMRVIILPEEVTELEIQRIENRYQLQSEGKSEYQGLNRAIKFKRNIENGFTLAAQLRDDPNYHELSDRDFKKQVKKFEKDFIKPLECVDKYLNTFERDGMYNTISENAKDREGRWQAFIDYSNFKTGTLENERKTTQLKIKENEKGRIENAVFKIIRKRSLSVKGTDLGKVHEFVRKVPKYLANDEAKKLILEIADVPEDIPEELKYDKSGNKLSEREIDEKWGANNREKILGNLIKAYGHLSNQEQRDKPLELLEDALKKLQHDNLKIENMGIDYYGKALDLTKNIIEEAEKIHKAIDDARYKMKKLSKKK